MLQAGPVTAPPKSRYQEALAKRAAEEDEDEDEEIEDAGSSSEEVDDEELSELDEDEEMASADSDSESSPASDDGDDEPVEDSKPTKKRKRGDKDEELEDTYMQKLAREEAKDDEKRKKKQKTDKPATAPPTEEQKDAAPTSDVDADSDSDSDSFVIPKHETQLDPNTTTGEVELEKASRTVFLGNVSSEAIESKTAKKQLEKHLKSFIDDLADAKPPHKLESIRFRSTAFSSSLPKRAAFAKKELMDTTTKSTNAYAVYTTQTAAREAARRLNGTTILGRHLRVDSVAHPSKVDHRRCVFVGNLGFVDDESASQTNPSENKKPRPAGDVEEGLWRQFSKAGKVQSVRVPRDAQTRVGKGFAYVQFEDETSVEAALLFNDQKFPPLLPRKLRVTRSRAQKKSSGGSNGARKGPAPSSTRSKDGAYKAKIQPEQKSNQGRAKAVLGKAAAFKSAEAFVFEGHRASSRQGKAGLKLGGKKGGAGGAKKKGPNGRKERSKAWKTRDAKK